MTRPKIAVDLDGTLAATHDTAFDLMLGPDHDYDYTDIESWEWGLNKFGTERYLSAIWHSWTLRPLEVEPTEENLTQKMAALHADYEVHIVTANPDHMGIEEGKKEWLDYHSIPHEDFHMVPPRTTKADYLDYSLFVDDKPLLPQRAADHQTVYVYDRPYNQDIVGDYIRVQSIADLLKSELKV